jgi:energy-coupling factor transporter ATP-binding protein EcfA2
MDERSGAVVGDSETWASGTHAGQRGESVDGWQGRRSGRRSASWAPEPWERASQEQDALTYALDQLRAAVDDLSFPFEMPGVLSARSERQFVLDRLEGYVLPRVAEPDAPLLVVIGGSTGAGKSTLTNSLIGVDVSPSGFLRPTTRQPVLVHNPVDTAAFVSHRILPHLSRTTIAGYSLDGAGPPPSGTASLQLVPHDAVPPGLAIVDSPDLDSVVSGNRTLAQQLFRAADLWIFVTTGTDYADAVPWDLLGDAVQRRVAVAVVLDRMRVGELEPVRMHFATMLIERGLSSAPVFTLPDASLTDGMLPAKLIAPLQGWLDRQASEAVRGAHIERAVDGTLGQVLDRIDVLAAAADEQVIADRRLRVDLEALFGRARERLLSAAVDGSVPADARVRNAWSQLADATDPSTGGRLRRRVTAALRGNARFAEASTALRATLVTTATAHVEDALDLVSGHWHNHPVALEQLAVDSRTTPFRIGADFRARTEAAVLGWQGSTQELTRPGTARHAGDPGEDPLVLALTTLATGPSGEPATAAHTLLEAGDGTVPVQDAVRIVRDDLLRRLAGLVTAEAERLRVELGGAGATAGQGRALREAADAVRELLPRG